MQNNISVSFVLPMFNERENIEITINKIKAIAGEITSECEIIVVDDASTDDSADIVEGMSKLDSSIRLIRLEKNTKFGGAFAAGFKAARKEAIVYMDSDMPVSLEDIKASFPLIQDVDIVSGYSRVKKGDTVKRKVMSMVYNRLVQFLFGLNVKDINSGYKIVRRQLIQDMEFVSKSPFVDVELFIHARRKGAKVRQFPLVFLERLGGRSYMARPSVIFATFRDMIKVKIKEPK